MWRDDRLQPHKNRARKHIIVHRPVDRLHRRLNPMAANNLRVVERRSPVSFAARKGERHRPFRDLRAHRAPFAVYERTFSRRNRHTRLWTCVCSLANANSGEQKFAPEMCAE